MCTTIVSAKPENKFLRVFIKRMVSEYKVFEKIAESETENSNFHLMLSNMYLGYADIYDERDFDEEDDIDKERIEQLSIINKALFYPTFSTGFIYISILIIYFLRLNYPALFRYH